MNSAPAATSWESRGTSCQPKPRWVRGHQIFAALTQGLIFSFQCMGVRSGPERMRRCKNGPIFPSVCCGVLRRPLHSPGISRLRNTPTLCGLSMMPPESEVGLSGLMSIDHRFLAQTMRDMRPWIRKSLSEHDPARHHGIALALSRFTTTTSMSASALSARGLAS